MHVPCIIFDGKSEDFATEMFVIINSTPTRINKSHLVDLYERVSWAAPDKKFAAQRRRAPLQRGRQPAPVPDQPPRRPLASRRSGSCRRSSSTRSTAGPRRTGRRIEKRSPKREAERFYEVVRDFFKAAEKVWGSAWGNAQYMVTRPGDDQGDAARVRRPRARRRRAGRGPHRPLGAQARRRGASCRRASASRASTSASRPRARSSASARVHRELGRAAGIEPRKRKGDARGRRARERLRRRWRLAAASRSCGCRARLRRAGGSPAAGCTPGGQRDDDGHRRDRRTSRGARRSRGSRSSASFALRERRAPRPSRRRGGDGLDGHAPGAGQIDVAAGRRVGVRARAPGTWRRPR